MNGTSKLGNLMSAHPKGGDSTKWTVQEENDWLRSVLRLAEAHIKHEKEELRSLQAIYDRAQGDSDQRVLALEARMRATEKQKAEVETRLHREREQIRVLEAKLQEMRNQTGRSQDLVQRAFVEEQQFLDEVNRLKASFAERRAHLDAELSRLRIAVAEERAGREAAVQRENSVLARYRALEGTAALARPVAPPAVATVAAGASAQSLFGSMRAGGGGPVNVYT